MWVLKILILLFVASEIYNTLKGKPTNIGTFMVHLYEIINASPVMGTPVDQITGVENLEQEQPVEKVEEVSTFSELGKTWTLKNLMYSIFTLPLRWWSSFFGYFGLSEWDKKKRSSPSPKDTPIPNFTEVMSSSSDVFVFTEEGTKKSEREKEELIGEKEELVLFEEIIEEEKEVGSSSSLISKIEIEEEESLFFKSKLPCTALEMEKFLKKEWTLKNKYVRIGAKQVGREALSISKFKFQKNKDLNKPKNKDLNKPINKPKNKDLNKPINKPINKDLSSFNEDKRAVFLFTMGNFFLNFKN